MNLQEYIQMKELREAGYAVDWFDDEHKAFEFLVQYLAGEYPPF